MIEKILNCLPEEISQFILSQPVPNEIRLRSDRNVVLVYPKKNIITEYIITKKQLELTVLLLCKKSMHTFSEFIINGFIPYENGCRIGIAGEAVCEGNKITNIRDIQSINIRIVTDNPAFPSEIANSAFIFENFIIYSPPNFGKTTLLRYFAEILSSHPHYKKICVCDSRGELFGKEDEKNFNGDVLRFYPKNIAVDTALRCLSPEIIICDELGLEESPDILEECVSSGVQLICSAHAGSISELVKRKNIIPLHKNKIFSGYLGINIENGIRTYNYTPRERVIV